MVTSPDSKEFSGETRWQLLVSDAERAFVFPLPRGRRVVAGRKSSADLNLDHPTIADEQLALRVAESGVELSALAGGVQLNDVQLSGKGYAKAGDQLTLGPYRLLLQGVSPLPPKRKPIPLPHWIFCDRLEEEVERCTRKGSSLALLLIHSEAGHIQDVSEATSALGFASSRSWVVGSLAPPTLELLGEEMERAECEAALGRLASALGRKGGAFRLGYSLFPSEAEEVHPLWERALARLLEPQAPPVWEEPLWLDPVLVRLTGLFEQFAKGRSPLILRGESGVGRLTAARVIHRLGFGDDQPFLVGNPASEDEAALLSASSGTLYLPDFQRLGAPVQKRLLELAGPRVICAGPPARGPAHGRPMAGVSPVELEIPALRDRPSETVPLAEFFLNRARDFLKKSHLWLNGRFEELLKAYPWPGNVRELKNAMTLLALASEGAEADFTFAWELLKGPMESSALSPGMDFRRSMEATEREALLRVLGQTDWNVTQAAKQLGLPRRTIVYRLRRLGVRRPKSVP